MQLKTGTGNTARPFRDAHTIGDIAVVEAQRREQQCERSGQLYMLAEILTALHRQAEVLEHMSPTFFFTETPQKNTAEEK